ncbi:hypothetical protein HJFPF1_10114 [Paramyrothecium foliicola]|nr:hypothetical protein HJFPF1_10114 [Paramyrothecium foliicola]
MADSTSTRRPLKGSCHCGAIRYLVFLTLPHQAPQSMDKWKSGQSIYRCNCSVCHKIGFYHVRVNFSPDDFLLLSPLDPLQQLGDYMCGDYLHFLYCKTCATRCFIFMGQGEIVDVDMVGIGGGGSGTQLCPATTVKAWRPKKEGWVEGKVNHGCYLSINGFTIDPGQEGFDLRELTEEKRVVYIDYLHGEDRGLPRFDRPHDGGAY